MTTLEVLKRGLERVRKGWCQHYYAKTADGHGTGVLNPEACSWCAVGAVNVNDEARTELMETLGFAPHPPVGIWNDAPERTQADVIALFERTIARLEARPSHPYAEAEGAAVRRKQKPGSLWTTPIPKHPIKLNLRAAHPTPWRVGRTVGRTIYDANDVLIGMMDSRALAAQVVLAVNRRAVVAEHISKLLGEES